MRVEAITPVLCIHPRPCSFLISDLCVCLILLSIMAEVIVINYCIKYNIKAPATKMVDVNVCYLGVRCDHVITVNLYCVCTI